MVIFEVLTFSTFLRVIIFAVVVFVVVVIFWKYNFKKKKRNYWKSCSHRFYLPL